MATDEKGKERVKDLQEKPVSAHQAEEVKGGFFGSIVKGIGNAIGAAVKRVS
jgi:hypothetical protein